MCNVSIIMMFVSIQVSTVKYCIYEHVAYAIPWYCQNFFFLYIFVKKCLVMSPKMYFMCVLSLKIKMSGYVTALRNGKSFNCPENNVTIS